MQIAFTIRGQQHYLTDGDVIKALESVDPGVLRSHVVEINGRRFPVKQALAEVTGLDVLDFNTNQARSVLQRLGFSVIRMG